MKNLINNLMFIGLLVLGLSFNACQEEFEEVGGNGEEQETITTSSTTADLIIKTASNDGSFDNIVDGASCLAIEFPYTVEVGGIQITIDSIEDLHLIEEIFDEFDDDEDILDIIFPITITLGDFTEVVIENKEALRELAAECLEGGDDDDIECIDFVYPITLFTFDVNEQETGSVTVNSDRELRLFFKERDDNELVSIDFPVTLIKADGTEIVVNSNGELANVIDSAKDECDEDDDDDYNDDDFDEERFDFCLTECPWEVREVIRADVDSTEQYLEYIMNFMEDGTVNVIIEGDIVVPGTWSSSFTDEGPLLTLEFDQLVDFNLEWLVYEIGDHTIKLFANDGSDKIILKQLCDDDEEGQDPDTLREILKECSWIIRKVVLQNEEIDRLLGFEFEFLPEGVATLSDGITTGEGSWEIGYNDEEVLSLLIEFGSEPAVNFNWPLRDLDDDRLKFEIEEIGYELVLQRECNSSAGDEDVSEIRNIMLGGQWNVALYDDEGMDQTEAFSGMDFSFSNFNQVEVSVNDDPILAGVWRILRGYGDNLKFYLNLGDDETFGELTEAWFIGEVSADRIELIYEDENINFKKLVFEKKM
ncbi:MULTISPECIES: hypothetical protein [Croceitalea]|uniref:Lipocalin-like domain-containing protein n=1 Tax=Croceitalea vernalis TaxID=3075599 RepID=A0ABU3BJL4_9FLAO|nr:MULTISPECIES: hypothetical protein [unclassified Croceitalea]MDT0540494.1 hypothetical protein [Croceitalea sp. P059]MDT0622350.1 hypothetical protein [Croceitalea sp. P007]